MMKFWEILDLNDGKTGGGIFEAGDLFDLKSQDIMSDNRSSESLGKEGQEHCLGQQNK